MSDAPGKIQAASDGGLSGEHDSNPIFPILLGPTTANEFNTIHLPLVPRACWRVDDIRFAFDSSFVDCDPDAENPNDIRAELAHLIRLLKKHPGAPLTVFGHADPVGSDDYNKLLGGRRAAAVYGLLLGQGDVATSTSLWQQIAATENWGTSQNQKMQALTGLPAGTSQASLIQAYLQALCPAGLVLTKANFLAQGSDANGKGDYQGCGEFNPVLIFSQEQQDEFAQDKAQGDADGIAERNLENAPNRRVMVMLFKPGSQVVASKWPCPRASEGVAGCKKRFWSNGEERRSTHLSGVDRKFEETKDTFACRFYQRLGTTCDHRRRLFRYVLEDIPHLPWPDDATLRVLARDGSPGYEFLVGDGRVVSTGHEFLLADVQEDVEYKGEVTSQRLKLDTFGYTELYRIADPDDDLKVLALPDVPKFYSEADEDSDDSDSDDSDSEDDTDDDDSSTPNNEGSAAAYNGPKNSLGETL